jgi:hypothetical protein
MMAHITNPLILFDQGLILLCHKLARRVCLWQHGHRWSLRAMARVIEMRTEVIEFGM